MKSLLVHLDASPRAAVRLALAHRLARTQGAHLTALYAVLPMSLSTPWATVDGMAAAMPMLEEIDRDRRAAARATFALEAEGGDIEWAEAGNDSLHATLLDRALYADLLVLGQTDPDDTRAGALPPDMVPTLIVDSGKPALVVPYAGDFASGPAGGGDGAAVLIAWKPTRESARAVDAALPWLRRAAEVHIAGPQEPDGEGRRPIAQLDAWLRLRGVTAPLRVHAIGGKGVGDELLSLAADVGAGLLVMGCYGHSRAREFVLGGASQTVLRSMTLPVLMAH
jgi:nucleotide-binding universal stress UspA family protein